MGKRRSSWGRQKYKNLKQSIVIFVCAFDLFGDNRSIYTFETICRENTDITLQDKRKTYFINIYGDRSGIEKDTVNLLDYFKTGEPTDDYTRKLQEKVEEIRCDDEWRENYMTIEMKMDQRFEDGMKLGRTEGEKNRDRELVQKWLKKGKAVYQIAQDLDKSEEYVKKMIKENVD